MSKIASKCSYFCRFCKNKSFFCKKIKKTLYISLKIVYPIDAYDFALYIISQFTHEIIRTYLSLNLLKIQGKDHPFWMVFSILIFTSLI